MRIIITQAEIEEAIKTHVLKQITIANNQNVSVDFKNTRGEDGATAEINISAKPNIPTEAPKPTLRTPVTKPVEQPETAVEEEVAPTVVETTEVSQEAAVVEPEGEVTDGTATEEPETLAPITATAESVAVDEPDEVAVSKPSGSLFAGLKRPQN